MDFDNSPDELLEERDQSLGVSPFENTPKKPASTGQMPSVKKNTNQAGAKNKLSQFSPVGGKGKGNPNKKESAAKKTAKKAADKAVNKVARGTAGKSNTEKLINKGLSEAAKFIPYVGKAVSLVIKKVGVKRIAIALVILSLVQFAVFALQFYFFTQLWEHPSAVVGLVWEGVKRALGISIDTMIDSGAASKMAYEFEVKNGNPSAVAAPAGGAPKEGTLAYKYSLIDWEKSKYQSIPNYTNCQVNTKEVQSVIDGSKRFVIDNVKLKDSRIKSPLKTTAKTICINKVYPIFNTIMRMPLLREGVNKELGVRFAYAEPKKNKSFEGKSKEEVGKILHEKTLKRIWNANLQSTLNADSANQQASNQAAADQTANQTDQPCDPKTTSITACENQNATQKENDKVEDLIGKRELYKKPCSGGTSISACESTAKSNKNSLLDANIEIIDILEKRFKDNLSSNNGEVSTYRLWSLQNTVACGPSRTGNCPLNNFQDAANTFADILIGYYNNSKASDTGNQNQTTTPPAPASASDSWPTSCQENFQSTAANEVDRAIAMAVNDLLCGKNPKSIMLQGVTLPPEQRGADPNTVSQDVAIASMQTLCRFTSRLLTDEEYKKVLRYRIASAANASWQAVTYAHTNRKRFLDIQEIRGDFYKVSSLVKSQEYNYPVNNSLNGEPLEQIAIGDAIGTQRTLGALGTGLDKGVGDVLYKQFGYSDDKDPSKDRKGICEQMTADGFVFDQNFANMMKNLFGINLAGGGEVSVIYKTHYQDLKKAIAALPHYTTSEPDVEITARNMTLADVILYLVKVRSNVSDTGTEYGPQNFNRMSLGMKAYMNAASLAMGGQFLRAEQSIALETQVESARRYEEKTRGIAYRLFDTENPRSLLSRLSAGTIAEPKVAIQNVASTLLSLFNPIDSLVSGRKSLVYYLTGENNTALAASDYDRNNLRLDPAGVPDELVGIDPLQNAAQIEGMKERGENTDKFGVWDGCFKKFIATEQLHLQEDNPTCVILFTSHKDLQRDLTLGDLKRLAGDAKYSYLTAIIDQNQSSPDSAVVWPYSLARQYRAYHHHNLQADALIYLSDPDKEDESLNASSSSGGTGGGGTECGTGPCPDVQVDKATGCSGGPKPGTTEMADFVMQKFNTSNLGIYNCRSVRGGSSYSLHAEGRAFDAGLSVDNPDEKARGDQLFMWAMVNAANLGFQEIIWNHQIWTPSQGLHPYTGSNPHTDHVHLGQNNAGAAGQTAFYTSGAGKN